MKLSAVLITNDEEAKIGRTLEALSFADEVVVIDSGSKDRTVEICRAHGARVLQHEFAGFGAQKRWATAQASHDWVLGVDADEVVTPELGRTIRALLDAGEPPFAAYRLSLRLVFLGRPFTHGPHASKPFIRLFDRRRARWTESPVHETIEVDGPVGDLPGIVMHHTAASLAEALAKFDTYSTLGAVELRRRGKRFSTVNVLLAGPFHFVRQWIVQGNFLNGVPGLAWSVLTGAGAMVKRLKLHEMEKAG